MVGGGGGGKWGRDMTGDGVNAIGWGGGCVCGWVGGGGGHCRGVVGRVGVGTKPVMQLSQHGSTKLQHFFFNRPCLSQCTGTAVLNPFSDG